ncbi:MAG: hypothetical protein QXT32_03720 [Candidatus Nitrosocaldaceae archaeon]
MSVVVTSCLVVAFSAAFVNYIKAFSMDEAGIPMLLPVIELS